MSAASLLYKRYYLYFGLICLVIIGSLQGIFFEVLGVTPDLSPMVFPTLTIFLIVFHLFIAFFMAMKYWCVRRQLHLMMISLAFAGSAAMMVATLTSFPSWLAPLQPSAINYNDTLIFFTFRNVLLATFFIASAVVYVQRDKVRTRNKAALITYGSILFTLIILMLAWQNSSQGSLFNVNIELINNDTRKLQALWVHNVNIALIALWLVTLFVVMKITRLRNIFWWSISFVCVCYIMTLVMLLKDSGSESTAWYSARLFETAATMLIIFVLLYDVFSLYRDSRHKYKESWQNAIRDPLTRLYNRSYFYDSLTQRLHTVTPESPFSLIVGDIDHFKTINDTYGHLQGDRVIQFVSTQFADSVRAEDIVARIGGEEFVIMLKGATSDVARQIAERIRNKVNSHNPDSSNVVLATQVTVSIGVYTVHSALLSAEECVERADRAMYQAKRSGRNQVAVFA